MTADFNNSSTSSPTTNALLEIIVRRQQIFFLSKTYSIQKFSNKRLPPLGESTIEIFMQQGRGDITTFKP
jgi:hypothetical protein